ncbi:MAG: cupin domain-containing protein [Pseudomonadota bacterium]
MNLELDRSHFLSHCWQRRPLFMPAAVPDFIAPISANELAGLALDADIESRIIEQVGESWQQSSGPFTEQDFKRSNPWTLLVQAVDHFVPEVAALKSLVSFLPSWRIDDVMVSYATDGGSVGPHFDNYDVFLLQGEGQRQWRLGQYCDSNTALQEHSQLRLLAEFESREEYTLDPGDVLYVPPGVAHWGIAQGECTTFSLGFRAPRLNTLLSRWLDDLLARAEPDQFYRDPDIDLATQVGEIRPADIESAREQLLALLISDAEGDWFGEVVTEPRYPLGGDLSDGIHYDIHYGADELAAQLQRLASRDVRISIERAAKVAWQRRGAMLSVYANGESTSLPAEVLPLLQTLLENSSTRGPTLGLDQGADTPERCLLSFLLESGALNVE